MTKTIELVSAACILSCGGVTMDPAIDSRPLDAARGVDSPTVDAVAGEVIVESAAEAPLDAPQSLTGVPVEVGDMAFNEVNNVGFSKDISVRWSSTGMLVSSSGHFTAK